jgi:hypothetical protein
MTLTWRTTPQTAVQLDCTDPVSKATPDSDHRLDVARRRLASHHPPMAPPGRHGCTLCCHGSRHSIPRQPLGPCMCVQTAGIGLEFCPQIRWLYSGQQPIGALRMHQQGKTYFLLNGACWQLPSCRTVAVETAFLSNDGSLFSAAPRQVADSKKLNRGLRVTLEGHLFAGGAT